MRAPADLHPDDLAARVELRNILITCRRELGLSHRGLATRLRVATPGAARLERKTSWQVSTVHRWAAVLGGRLLLHPGGEPDRLLDVFRPADPVRVLEWDRERLREAMVDARRDRGLSQADVGGPLGVSESAVQQVERVADPGLCTVQRYCRAIEVPLWVGVQW